MAEDENNCTRTDLPDCDRECETTMEYTGQLISDNEHEQKVLGLQWNPKDDCFHFKVVLNFAARIRKVRSGPNLSQDQVPASIPTVLTKRMVLSQINGTYDPMGLATPFTIKAKILMRRLWLGGAKSLGWDDPMSEFMRSEWISYS